MRNSVQLYASEFENIDKMHDFLEELKFAEKFLIMISCCGRLFLAKTQNLEFIKFRERALTSYKFF